MTAYTKTFSKLTGDTINANDFILEFQALEDAFLQATGHRHDGTAGEGGYIPLISGQNNYTSVEIDSPNAEIDFNVNVASAKVRQLYIADGAFLPNTDNDIDLGSPTLEFKNLYIDGVANIDSLVADTADINGGTIDGVAIAGSSTINNTVIGGTAAAAGTFTALVATSLSVPTITGVSSADINGGAIDGTTIGAASPSSGIFTTLKANTSLAIGASQTITYSSSLLQFGENNINGDGTWFLGQVSATGGFSVAPVTTIVNSGIGRLADGDAEVGLTSVSGVSTANAKLLRKSGTNGLFEIRQTGTGSLDIIHEASGNIRFLQGTTNVFQIAPSGIVCTLGGCNIGQGVSTDTATIRLGSARTDTGFSVLDFYSNTEDVTNGYGTRIIRSNTATNAATSYQHRGTGLVSFQNVEAAAFRWLTSNTERIRLTADGKVGIGTNSPDSNLEVVGILKVSSTGPFFMIEETDQAADNKIWSFASTGGELFIQGLTDAGAGGGNLMKFTRTGNSIDTMQFQKSAVTWLTFDNSSRVATLGASANLVLSNPTVPASPTDTGTTGQISWDSNYIYVCVATNTWKRAGIGTGGW